MSGLVGSLRWVPVCLLFLLLGVAAEDAAGMQEKGIAALKESQTNPRAIVEAARQFAKAAQAYTDAGDEAKAVEMNSYLYWCRKKMTVEDIASFERGGEMVVSEKLNAVEKNVVAADKAQEWFDRAEAFARSRPDEHLLIAVRFFEVADRFKGTDLSLQSQDRSLKEQTQALAAAGGATAQRTTDAPPRSETTLNKAAVPDAAKVKDAVKEVRTILKDDYAKTKVEEKRALAKKLIEMAVDPTNQPAAKYAELSDARDVALEIGDGALVVQVLDRLAESFVMDAAAERLATFRKLMEGQREKRTYRSVSLGVLKGIDDAIAGEQYASLKQLASVGEAAAARTGNAGLIARMKDKAAAADEVQREWGNAKSALEKLKTDPQSAAANLTAGKFWMFMKGDAEHGLPALSRGSDAALKKIADADLANPSEGDPQVAVADQWWGLSEKERSRQAKLMQMTRAAYWYSKALPALSALNKAKAEQRIAQAAAEAGGNYPPDIDLEGKWRLHWANHPEYGTRNVEWLGDGAIKIKPGDNYGDYVPFKWSFKDKMVIVHYRNKTESKFAVTDENTLTQTTSDGVYTRRQKE